MTYDYHEPREVAEALHLLVKHGEDAHLIAGGTATVLLLRQG
ncbi:MAG: xanthine dehydrogenase family protein subunit M, partial [Chloroflexi bacterium]